MTSINKENVLPRKQKTAIVETDAGAHIGGREQRGDGVCAGKVRRKVEKTKWKKTKLTKELAYITGLI